MPLDGKHALITGSSRGTGRGIALKLAETGAKVAIHYYQNERAANDTLAQVRKRGSDGFVVQADVTRPEDITEMFRKVKTQFGRLDIFVSNARPEAATFFQPPLDITLKQWDTAFDSQAKAFLVGVREALPLMSNGGSIIAITYAQGSRTGRHGISESSIGVARPLLCRCCGKARYHGKCDQPRMDGRQRVEHIAGGGPAVGPKLAQGRLDANGPSRNTRRRGERGRIILFGQRPLDHRAGDLRRRRRVVDESRGSARNPDWITWLLGECPCAHGRHNQADAANGQRAFN